MMTIDSILSIIVLGDPSGISRSDSEDDPFYDALDIALEAGSLTVSEVTDNGHVSEIKGGQSRSPVRSHHRRRGAHRRQADRTVNLSILATPEQDTIIPVTASKPAAGTRGRRLRGIATDTFRRGTRGKEPASQRIAARPGHRHS